VGELQAPTDTRETAGGAPGKDEVKQVRLVGKPYTALGPFKRLAVSLGGPLSNFILAIVVFAFLGSVFGIAQSKEISVADVVPNSVADVAGFKAGDIIVEAGGRRVTVASDVNRVTELSSGEAVIYRVLRGGEPVNLVATPVETEETN